MLKFDQGLLYLKQRQGDFLKTVIYTGGDIITMDENYKTPQAVAVKEGKIAAVGSLEEIKAKFAQAEIVNLDGKTLIPAFIDAHSHFTMQAQSLGMVDLRLIQSMEELQKAVLEFKQKHYADDDSSIIMGFGYDHNNMPNLEHPTAKVLDETGVKNPIALIHVSSHMGAVNTPLLKMIGHTAETPDPKGGKIGRLQDGSPNGYLEESAFMGLLGMQGKPDMPKVIKSLENAAQYYAKNGITTAQDGMTGPAQLVQLSAVADAQKLPIDIVMMYEIAPVEKMLEDAPKYADLAYHNNLRMGGYKIFLDGSPQGHTAWLSYPYENRENYSGYPIYTDEQVTAFCEKAINDNMQILVHCNGDAASEQFVNCYEKALANTGGSTELRPVMVHAQTVREDQLKRMAKLKIMPSFFTAHTHYWGDVHRINLGEKRASQISPSATARELGMTFTYHQDCPVLPADMMKTIWCAVNRLTKSGHTLGENQKVDVYTALKAVTINAAWQYFEDDKKGSITPGKLADLVILDKNPLKTEALELDKIKILETLKEGRTIYKA